jgi:hypothetical protein
MRGGPASPWRCYSLGACGFFGVFAFLLVLWGASKSYKPHIVVKVRPSSLFSPLILLFPLLFSLSRNIVVERNQNGVSAKRVQCS